MRHVEVGKSLVQVHHPVLAKRPTRRVVVTSFALSAGLLAVNRAGAAIQPPPVTMQQLLVHDRYNDVVRSTVETDERAFDKAGKTVQAGLHEPDIDRAGETR